MLIFMRTVSNTSPGPSTSSRMMTMLLVLVLPSIWIDSTLNLSLSSTWYSRSMLPVLMLGLRLEVHPRVEVAVLAVEVLQALDVLVELGRGEDHAAPLPDATRLSSEVE